MSCDRWGGVPNYVEYRAVAYDERLSDAERESYDTGPARSSRPLAEADLEELCAAADPPYDDGWIESRELTQWKKTTR